MDQETDQEMDQEMNQPSTSSGITKENKTRKSKMKIFQYSWLNMDIFKNWLAPHENNEKAFCTICEKVLLCGKSDLLSHSKTKLHVENFNISRNRKSSTSLSKLASNVKDEDHIMKVETAEIKLAAFYAEHNMDLHTSDHFVPLLKEICSDSQVVYDLKVSRRKCAQIIKNIVGKAESDNIISILKKQKFSILIDESMTISNDKVLCILVKYVSLENMKCKTQLLELLVLDTTDCSAEKLYFAFEKCLKEKGIPFSNIVGMACDNTNIIIGIRDSFATRLRKEVPNVIVLNCICHSSALIASKACSKLPNACENILHSVATYSSSTSTKKSATLYEFQNFFGAECNKFLKLFNTRWLVLHKAVVRLLDNWEALKLYFYLETIENDSKMATTIFTILNDNKIKAYMFFLKYSLHSFNSFNALFQGRNILIHKLAESSEHLIKQMGYNFLLSDALKNISMDSINSQNFLPLTSIYVGPECEELLQLESSEFAMEVKSTCLSFYTTALEEMIQRLPYNNDIYRELKFLDPSVALWESSRLTVPDLRNVAKYFQISDVTALAVEWRTLPIIFNDADKAFLTNLEIDDMWKKIFEKKFFNKPYFPNLQNLICSVMSLPHSNTEAQRIFAVVTDAKNKKRN